MALQIVTSPDLRHGRVTSTTPVFLVSQAHRRTDLLLDHSEGTFFTSAESHSGESLLQVIQLVHEFYLREKATLKV